MIPLDLALAPPDAFQTALSDIRRVYCEDDFLLDNKAVDTLATKYDELRVTVKEVESNLGKYQEEARGDQGRVIPDTASTAAL